ncbi:MAG: formate dehydrogenase subunit alpha [Eubacteriales bacterium]|nr:formate dehydrogenase subunit alpha [Eubacteriales bacterium]MDZ7609221.1 formate dehydrogenase subunit alpha [Eubacteriales bacterium]
MTVHRVRTICPYCGVGCGLYLLVEQGRIVGVEADPEHPVSQGGLCLKGYYGYNHVGDPRRLQTPLIRKDGMLVPATWNEALNFIAEHLIRVRRQDPDAFALIASAKGTNEDSFAAQKFARVVMGTNNVDCCARLCHAPSVAGLVPTLGSAATTNTIEEIGSVTETIFIIGSNTSECHPLVAAHVIKARERGAKLIVADPRHTEMAARADIWLRVPVGGNIPLINGIMHILMRDGLINTIRVNRMAAGFDALAANLAEWTPERVENITGVPRADLQAAAHLYGKASTAAILYAMGVTQFANGTENVLALANLAIITGHLGRSGTGLFPLRGQNNIQGTCDMGCLPDFLPGYVHVGSSQKQTRFSHVWSVKPPSKPGIRATEISEGIMQGKIRVLYVFGANPVLSGPDTGYLMKALERLDLLIVQDIFLTETARLAGVVLPAACAAEKDGTFTNTERRIQRVRMAVPPPGDARPDWRIFSELAREMGSSAFPYRSPEEIWGEIRLLIPERFGGVAYKRLNDGPGILWPCPDEAHPGTPILYSDNVFLTPSGKAQLKPVPIDPEQTSAGIVEKPDKDYPLVLTTGRRVYHYHTGTITRKEWVLNQIGPEELVEINPEDGRRKGIRNGDLVRVCTRRGLISARAWITDRVPPGTIFMTFHFWEAPVNELTGRAQDPVCGIPELKASAADIKSISSVDARMIRRQKKERYLVSLEVPVNRRNVTKGD